MKRAPILLALLIGLATLGFYAWHLCPTTTWGDSADLHLAADQPLGTDARSYPLYVVLERLAFLIPTTPPEFAVNLMTAALGALAAALLFLVVHRLTTSVPAAIVGAGAFACAHTPWSYAVITEVYSLNHVFLALWILLALRFRDGDRLALPALMLSAGLAMLHHRLLGLFLLPFLVFAILHRRGFDRRTVVFGFIALLVGVAPLVVLFSRQMAGGAEAGWLLEGYLTGHIRKSVFNTDLTAFARAVPEFLAYLVYNFPSPALPLAGIGIVSLARRDRGAFALIGSVFVVYGVFAIAYRHHGIWVAYTTHAWLAVAILAGVGASACLRSWSGRTWRIALPLTAIVLPCVVYPATPWLLDRLDKRPFAVPDAARFHRWYLDPSHRGDTLPQDVGRGILEEVPDGSVVLTDWGVAAVLRLVRHREGRGARVDIRYDVADPATVLRETTAPVYHAHFPYYAPALRVKGWRLERVRDDLPLYRVVRENGEDGR